KFILEDLIAAGRFNYVHYSGTDQYTSIRHFGYFFPEIVAHPERYIYPAVEFRETLRRLRYVGGKYLFVLTNSHYEYLDHTMSFAYGRDWADLFDLVVCKAGKPTCFVRRR